MKIPYRRVIPTGYHVGQLQLVGTAPLLMKSGEADREGDLYRAFRQLSTVRGKTLEQESRLRELEWRLALYYDQETGCYIPGKNVKELLREAATKWRKGSDVQRSLVIPAYRIPLQYDGPRTVDELWDAGYRYTTLVSNAGAGSGRVDRTRPCFETWALETEVGYDPEDLDFDTLQAVVDRSQKYGLGDYRPTFGSFAATFTFVREQRTPTRTSANKRRNGREERANAAMVKRVMARK